MARRAQHIALRTMNTTIPTTTQLGAAMEHTARRLVPVVALLITAVLLLIELSYGLGHQLGTAVHERNDQLARLWRRLWVPQARVPQAAVPEAPVPEAVQHVPAAPMAHPLAELAVELEAMSCRQLQQLTGCRRKAAKRQLIALALAC